MEQFLIKSLYPGGEESPESWSFSASSREHTCCLQLPSHQPPCPLPSVCTVSCVLVPPMTLWVLHTGCFWVHHCWKTMLLSGFLHSVVSEVLGRWKLFQLLVRQKKVNKYILSQTLLLSKHYTLFFYYWLCNPLLSITLVTHNHSFFFNSAQAVWLLPHHCTF